FRDSAGNLVELITPGVWGLPSGWRGMSELCLEVESRLRPLADPPAHPITLVKPMQLIVEAGRAIENPTSGEIAEALSFARFAVLTSEPDSASYIQFARSRKRGIELEYQIDSLANHFRAIDPSLTMERVVAAFQKYVSRDDSWKTDFQWVRLDV